MNEPVGSRPQDLISPREIEVLRLVAQGLANKQVGRTLGISERTLQRRWQDARVRLARHRRAPPPPGARRGGGVL